MGSARNMVHYSRSVMPIIFPSVQYIETFINALDNLLIGPFNYEFSLLLINSY